jgi:protein TonB
MTHIRKWIAIALCVAAISWRCAGPAQASEVAATDGPKAESQTAATTAKEEPRKSPDFKIVDEMPKVLKQVPPEYPKAARERGDTGTVYVRALVKKDGKPTGVTVASGKGVTPELDQAAVKAVSQWTFVPAKARGKSVAVWIVVPVKFRLK